MKIYTFYSPSHKQMFEDFFLESYNKFLSADFELTTQVNDQKAENGSFFDPGFTLSMYDKLDLLTIAIKENENKWFVYADCDIQFLDNIKEDLLTYIDDSLDLIAQEDYGSICAGFLLIKGSKKMLDFIEIVRTNLKHAANDQIVINALKNMINYKLLPKDKYFTIGNYNRGSLWTPSHEIKLPNKILMHHANFTAGVENKIIMLDLVKKLNESIVSDRRASMQKQLNDYFSEWRKKDDSSYPPYHEGQYLEEYFFDRYISENPISDRLYIPVFWTKAYTDMARGKINTGSLQAAISRLNPNMKYFTVAQHDDAVREQLPPNTICFNAGGNGNGIPIPLICSPIPDHMKPIVSERDIFCSFVGSVTHPIRNAMQAVLKDNSRYHINAKKWTDTIEKDDLSRFIEITSRSTFALCPRGYGKSSFRLYEAMQLGAIPVFIYDQKWMPFEDEIDWEEFCVMIHANDIKRIDEILTGIDDARVSKMRESMERIWKDNFTMQSVYNRIIDRL